MGGIVGWTVEQVDEILLDTAPLAMYQDPVVESL